MEKYNIRYISALGHTFDMEMAKPTFSKMRALIEAETGEYVYLPANMVLLVDEDSIAKSRPLNEIASGIACRPIYGDALQMFTPPEDLPYD